MRFSSLFILSLVVFCLSLMLILLSSKNLLPIYQALYPSSLTEWMCVVFPSFSLADSKDEGNVYASLSFLFLKESFCEGIMMKMKMLWWRWRWGWCLEVIAMDGKIFSLETNSRLLCSCIDAVAHMFPWLILDPLFALWLCPSMHVVLEYPSMTSPEGKFLFP